ncbi:hypothetical protein ACOBR2_10550 [Telmatobacter bradus]|uniref:hypothetical protein n=1 Tax=Telmatobacter bradus TaxID=474953 RepID=UPI003B43119D
MSVLTCIFGVLLVALGVGGLEWKETVHSAAIYPIVFGLLMIVSGILTKSKNEKRHETFLYVSSGVAVLGLLLSALMALNGYGSARSEGVDVDVDLLRYRLVMAATLFVYLNLSVRSILNLRAAKKAAAEQD